MKLKMLLNKLSKTIRPLCFIFEYDLNKIELDKFNFDLPANYLFKFAKNVSRDLLKEFAKKHRKDGYYENIILPNLSNNNVIGISVVYKEEEIAMLSWIYLKLKPSKKGLQKMPFYNQSFYPMDGWVVKEHRGKGFHKYSIFKRFIEAKKLDRRYGYGFVYISNIPALKDNDKFGQRVGMSFKINYPFKATFNIYKPSHWGLYLKQHIKI